MDPTETQDGYLSGQLIIAMPQMSDPRFARSVVFVCAHNPEGAMGLVINKLIGSFSFTELMEQMGIELTPTAKDIGVHFGGPVESSRGFVLHTDDYTGESTLALEGGLALTSTIDVLRSLAGGPGGGGPDKALFTLGYAGWAPGQLDGEIQQNGWLHAPADLDLVFSKALDKKWEQAIAAMGVDPFLLSSEAGHA